MKPSQAATSPPERLGLGTSPTKLLYHQLWVFIFQNTHCPKFLFQGYAPASIAKLRYINIGTTLKAKMAFYGAHGFISVVVHDCECCIYNISIMGPWYSDPASPTSASSFFMFSNFYRIDFFVTQQNVCLIHKSTTMHQ